MTPGDVDITEWFDSIHTRKLIFELRKAAKDKLDKLVYAAENDGQLDQIRALARERRGLLTALNEIRNLKPEDDTDDEGTDEDSAED